MMTTMLTTTNFANRTQNKSDKPWIHVRAILVARIWMGLAFFSAGRSGTALAGRQQCSLADAVSV